MFSGANRGMVDRLFYVSARLLDEAEFLRQFARILTAQVAADDPVALARLVLACEVTLVLRVRVTCLNPGLLLLLPVPAEVLARVLIRVPAPSSRSLSTQERPRSCRLR
jgi:hypothetical protein